MKIGDRVFVRGEVDEIRNDTVIIHNNGGYFGTDKSDIIRDVPTGMVTCAECKRKYMKSMGYYCDERTHPLNPKGHCERGEK